MKLANVTLLIAIGVCTCASPASPQRDLVDRDRRTASSASGWTLSYSSGTPLSINGDGQPVITMPTNGTVNMLTNVWTGSDARNTLYVTVTVHTTGAPLFQLAQGAEPTCRTPPSTRPYLEADGWTATPADDSYMRWWSRQAFIPLVSADTVSIAVPLTPDRWSGVSGQFATQNASSTEWFNRMVTGNVPGRAGLVFGGGCSYGHGLYVTGGSATLTVTQFETR